MKIIALLVYSAALLAQDAKVTKTVDLSKGLMPEEKILIYKSREAISQMAREFERMSERMKDLQQQYAETDKRLRQYLGELHAKAGQPVDSVKTCIDGWTRVPPVLLEGCALDGDLDWKFQKPATPAATNSPK